MIMYRPNEIDKLTTCVVLLIPTITNYYGNHKLIYPETGNTIYVNWKSYGGTESNVNGILSIIDTASITTWFRADITKGCRLKTETGDTYEIIGKPENIENANIYLRFKVQLIESGV